MRDHIVWVWLAACLAAGLGPVAAPVVWAEEPPTPPPSEALTPAEAAHQAAVTEIRRLGGVVEWLPEADGRPALTVRITGVWNGGDEGLALLGRLQGLERLRLGGKITDAGLAHLAGIETLRALDLPLLDMTDAGLAHLRGLTGLERLNLTYAPVTDAGLVHLEGLHRLHWLGLLYTRVSLAGVERLRRALPDTLIQATYSDHAGGEVESLAAPTPAPADSLRREDP